MGRYLQRWLEVDLPTGEHERVEFRQVADANQQADCYGLAPCTFRDESEVVPPAVNGALNDNADAGDAGPAYAPDNAVFLNFRNSYHWNPVGYARGRTEGSTGPVFDPRHAHVYHWSHQPASLSLTAPLLESEVPPGESRFHARAKAQHLLARPRLRQNLIRGHDKPIPRRGGQDRKSVV